jgi:leucyl-tRNA synthetase
MPVDLYRWQRTCRAAFALCAVLAQDSVRYWGGRTPGRSKLVHQGIVLGKITRRCRNPGGNVVNLTRSWKFGADAVRLYEMFMGPLEP